MSDPHELASNDLIDEQARRRFESDWHARRISEIENFLPDPSDSRYWATLEELLYIDLEFSWKEFERLPVEDTVSVHRSPTTRLKTVSQRLNLSEKRDLLQRLWDFEKSLREKSKAKKHPSESTGYEVKGMDIDTGLMSLDPTRMDSIGQDSEDLSENHFGDFILKDQLGRGGMGVVFRAIDKKTGRQVALKMIRSNIVSRVDDETRKIVMDRFQTEARAAANIEHPNIVTLFDVGIQDQTPYLSMQLVEGEDLATRIRRSVLGGKTAARYVQKVALAIDAAHRKGIIHRDLKPHNILLSQEFDEPLVTDFGLAKLTDESSDLTETGELLGTPGFMSPEQAQGKVVDHATDIYSLGATIYCLVGGRAPFQAADTMKTIEQIVKNPPLALREVNPDVELDLNTICLKCLEKDPSRRYSSAKELADDLGRFLNGEPIKARPVGVAERAVRWCRRNPLPTTIVIALIVLISVSNILLFKLNAMKVQSDAFSALNQANAELSFESNRDELFLIAEDASLKLPGMRETRESLLVPLRDFFEEYISINGSHPEFRTELAFAHFALGKIAHESSDDDSIDHLSNAVKLQRELFVEQPNAERIALDLSNSLNLRGECFLMLEKFEDSFKDFEEALELRYQLVADYPDNLEYRRKLANAQMNLGNWLSYTNDVKSLEQAIEFYALSNTNRAEFLVDVKDPLGSLGFNTRYDQARCFFNLAATQFDIEDQKSALKSAQQGMALFKTLHKERPRDLFVARDKARCAQLLADVDIDQDPGFHISEVAAAYTHITRLYPQEESYRWLAANALVRLGDLALVDAGVASADGDAATEKIVFAAAKESFESAQQVVLNLKPVNHDQKITVATLCLGMVPVHLRESDNLAAKEKIDLAGKILANLSESKHPDLDDRRRRWEDLKKIVEPLVAKEL